MKPKKKASLIPEIEEERIEEYVSGYKVRLDDLYLHKKFKARKEDIHTRRVLSWILLCYCEQSKLVRAYDDVEERKKYACELVGGKPKSELWVPIIEGEDERINGWVDYYLTQVQFNKEFHSLIVNEMAYLEYSQKIKKPISHKDPSKEASAMKTKENFQRALQDTIKYIDELKKKIWMDYYEELERGEEEVQRRIAPENISI